MTMSPSGTTGGTSLFGNVWRRLLADIAPPSRPTESVQGPGFARAPSTGRNLRSPAMVLLTTPSSFPVRFVPETSAFGSKPPRSSAQAGLAKATAVTSRSFNIHGADRHSAGRPQKSLNDAVQCVKNTPMNFKQTIALSLCLLSSACVSAGKFHDLEASDAALQAENEKNKQSLAAATLKIDELNGKLGITESAKSQLEGSLVEMQKALEEQKKRQA